ncbi:unnamed protein product [Mytilus edulis]|uniref:Uncharacterized protein n=1 Tax=Mytilus edulis TaxID=6550 RepID=A0A8S3TD33_MYTED|nr:unnamed protein product [Mytilus edulis]
MDIQPYKVDNIQKNQLDSVHALAQNSYNNNYTLNIEKSLKKKLESTKRSVIEYAYTGGGVTIKMDTISFELFIYALEQYFNDPFFKFHDYRKTIATDKGGNNVQYTYHIFDNPTNSYTINAYLTKCNLLINGKNLDKLFDRDIEHIHKIMSNTQINGANINTDLLNKNLASKLIDALDCLKKSATPHPGLPESKSTKTAVLITIQIPDIIDQSQDGHPISTKSSNHSDCLNTQLPNLNTKNLSTSLSDLEIAVQTTCKSIESNSHVAKSNHNNIELACTNTSAVPKTANPSNPDIPMLHNHHVINSKETSKKDQGKEISAKDFKLLEQKLKKKEEQLKIKEAILNDKSNDKSSILDRLFKAESRNLELEQSLKTLNQCLDNSVKNQAHMDSKTTDNHKQKQPAEDLIRGIHERVTEYVLKKVDRELSLLQSLDTDSLLQEKSTHDNSAPTSSVQHNVEYTNHSNSAPTSSVQHNVDYTNPHFPSYPYNTHYSRDNNIPFTNFNSTSPYQWGNGGTYHNVPIDSRDPYYPHSHNWNNYQDNSHKSYYPETRTPDYYTHGNWWGNGGTYHNVPPETFHHSYNRHSAENQVCFSNLISLTPTQLSANSASNTEANCREKTSTVRFHNSSTYSTGTTNNTPKEKDKSKFYGNDSSMYTSDDKTSSMLHVSRIGQPLYYSQDKSEQDFLYKELFQFERHKMMS